MPQYIDSYYLVNERDSGLVDQFLNDFLPRNAELALDYLIPVLDTEQERIFDNVREVLTYLDVTPDVGYIMYWENLNKASEIKQFTLMYTDDGKMIFGVSVIGNDLESKESLLTFYRIKRYLKAVYACITGEEPPPGNSEDFIFFCENRYVPIMKSIE